MLATQQGPVLGKIAAELNRALALRDAGGVPGRTTGTLLARGAGWSVQDVICTSGPQDRPFEERHSHVAIGMVVAGTFQYRSPTGHGLMTPGSLLLGNPGECYECGHEHAAGDRCVAFWLTPAYLESLELDAGARAAARTFPVCRLPPIRDSAALVAAVWAGVTAAQEMDWEELVIQVAATAIRLARGLPSHETNPPLGSESRVTDSVRAIEGNPATPWTLAQLAMEARQSAYHYLRMFRQVTGVTPHQFILRARLRGAATRLLAEDTRIIEIAFGAGFGDVSNFNRAFRAEFGVAPQVYRRTRRRADLRSHGSYR
jgi:AraC family transcriptional regulator